MISDVWYFLKEIWFIQVYLWLLMDWYLRNIRGYKSVSS